MDVVSAARCGKQENSTYVELEPLYLIALGSVHNLIEGARGQGGNHLDDIVLLGSTSKDDFTFRVSKLAQSGGCYVEGHADFGAQHCGRHVNLLDIDEDLWSEPDSVEGAVVLSHCLSCWSVAGRVVRYGASHDFIIGTTRVVGPSSLLHDSSGHSLEVHQVVALLKDGHALDSFLSLGLIWVFLLGFLLDSVHVDLAQVLALVQELVECVRWVDGFVLFGGILSGILEDDLGTTRMLGQELGHVVGSAVNDDPA